VGQRPRQKVRQPKNAAAVDDDLRVGSSKLGNHLQAGSARHNSGQRISCSIVGGYGDLHKRTMSGGDTGSNGVSLRAERQAMSCSRH